MSEEYTHVGTVRRRPRTGHQRSQPSDRNGKAGSNGHGHGKGTSQARREFHRESFYDRAPDTEERGSRREEEERRKPAEERARKALPYYGSELDEEPLFRFPFDPWRLYGAVKRNFGWILAGGALLGMVGFFVATFLVQYKVSMPLIRKTSNAVRSENVPAELQTLYSFMKAGPVLESVAQKAGQNPLLAPLGVTPQKLAEAIEIKPMPNPDIVVVSMEAFGGLRAMVDLINLYGSEMTSFMREMQRQETGKIREVLLSQIAQANSNITQLTMELGTYSDSGVVPYDKETATEIQNLW
jgi:hypothetical protein